MDYRWFLIPSAKERRSLFDEFCREIAKVEEQKKKQKEVDSKNNFLSLLNEVDQYERSRWNACQKKKLAEREEGEMESDSLETENEIWLKIALKDIEKRYVNDDRWKVNKQD